MLRKGLPDATSRVTTVIFYLCKKKHKSKTSDNTMQKKKITNKKTNSLSNTKQKNKDRVKRTTQMG